MFDNLDDPKKQLLLMMGLGLLGGAPGQRKNFGADLAHGGLLGLQGYSQAKTQQQKMARDKMQEELTGIQLNQARQGVKDEEAYRGALPGLPGFAPRAPNMTPTPENAAQLKRASPYEQAVQTVEYLRGKGINEKYIKPYVEQMEKFRPKGKADQQLVKLPDGSLGTINIMDDGTTQVLPYTPAEKMKDANLGGTTQLYGEYSGAPGQSFNRTLSPDTAFSGNITMRGQNMTDARARELNAITREAQASQVLSGDPNQGPMIVNKGTGIARPVMMNGQPVAGENQAKQDRNAGEVEKLIAQAEKIIPKATGSYLGAAIDKTAQVFGGAPGGAVATAQLKTLEGALLAKMPRFEGPQSNIDVQFYRQAAGQIGDPTVPPEMKQAALETIKSYLNAPGNVNSLIEKYLGKRR